MVTLGHQPYPGIDNADISTFVFAQRGNMVNTERFRPIGCPKNLWVLCFIIFIIFILDWDWWKSVGPSKRRTVQHLPKLRWVFCRRRMRILRKWVGRFLLCFISYFIKVAFITTQYKEQKGDTIADTTVFEDDSAASCKNNKIKIPTKILPVVPATIRDSTSYARNSSTSAGATDDSITEKEKRQRQQWTLMSGGDTSEIELPVDNDEVGKGEVCTHTHTRTWYTLKLLIYKTCRKFPTCSDSNTGVSKQTS